MAPNAKILYKVELIKKKKMKLMKTALQSSVLGTWKSSAHCNNK